ncbi:spore gernimation protein [Sporolactobacillus sp. THM7-4]|nr:spore gernimation protein [Sporolactobacillus sp. THM7-4]
MMQKKIREASQVSPIIAFFITLSIQIGIGVLSFQRTVSRHSGQDAWVVMLIAGLSTLAVMWMILRLLDNEQAYGQPDLLSIHRRLFGKWIGGMLNMAALSFVTIFGVVTLRSYIEILQVWVFPQLSVFGISIIFCLMVWYAVLGGFRVVAGICTLSTLYMLPLILNGGFELQQAHFSNLLPLLEHSPQSLMQSYMQAIHSYLGFELVLFFHPFIKRPEAARKWYYFGLLTALYIYLMVLILALTYFSQAELQTEIWPTLTFWKAIHFPLLEHFDIIGIMVFLWVFLPSISMSAWAISRGIKQTFPIIRQKYALIFVLVLFVILSAMIRDGARVEWINNLYTMIGFYFIYAYIPFLLIYQLIHKKMKQKQTKGTG